MTVAPEFESIIQWPLTRKADRGHPVSTLQHLLRHHDHDIAVGGVFRTEDEAAAVREFQEHEHLDIDVPRSPTWASPDRHGAPGRRRQPCVACSRRRSTGRATPIARRWSSTASSAEPRRSSRGFQEALRDSFPEDGLAVDGIVGPVTWRAFIGGFLWRPCQ